MLRICWGVTFSSSSKSPRGPMRYGSSAVALWRHYLSMAFVTKLPETAEIKWLAYLATVLNEASFNRCWRVTISVSEFVRMDRNSRTGTGALRNDGEAHEKADRGFN